MPKLALVLPTVSAYAWKAKAIFLLVFVFAVVWFTDIRLSIRSVVMVFIIYTETFYCIFF